MTDYGMTPYDAWRLAGPHDDDCDEECDTCPLADDCPDYDDGSEDEEPMPSCKTCGRDLDKMHAAGYDSCPDCIEGDCWIAA